MRFFFASVGLCATIGLLHVAVYEPFDVTQGARFGVGLIVGFLWSLIWWRV